MKRFKVIACEVAFRELCFCASQSNAIIDFSFMPRKLHIVGSEEMQDILQSEVDKVDIEQYDAILLAYGLCGFGVIGLKSELPIVIPKAYDCISIFLGSKERYTALKKLHPKAFYFTSGWLEREIVPNSGNVLETLSLYKTFIEDVIFVNTGVGNVEDYRAMIREKSEVLETTYIEIEGDNSMLLHFLNGEWDENDFTVIPASHKIIATNDNNIISYDS